MWLILMKNALCSEINKKMPLESSLQHSVTVRVSPVQEGTGIVGSYLPRTTHASYVNPLY